MIAITDKKTERVVSDGIFAIMQVTEINKSLNHELQSIVDGSTVLDPINEWSRNIQRLIHSASNKSAAFLHITDIANELGFEHCIYRYQAPLPIAEPRAEFFCSNSAWKATYESEGYSQIDPSIPRARSSSNSFLWSAELFKNSSIMWQNAKNHGLCAGWIKPERDEFGALGVLALVRASTPITYDELLVNRCKMESFVRIAHAKMSALITPRHAPEIHAKLSPRELEVMRWTADGKTLRDIAEILSIKERTVAHYASTASVKLNSESKDHAALKAAVLGLLHR